MSRRATGAPARWLLAMVLLAGLLLVGPPGARAQQRQQDPYPGYTEDVAEREWYGLPLVLADVASLSVLFGGIALNIADESDFASGMAILGLGGYLVSGPFVHMWNDRPGRALGSAALRLSAPLGGAGAGFIVGAALCEGCALEGAILGLMAGTVTGLLTAVVLDDAVLARKPVAYRSSALWLAPSYRPEERRPGLVLCGTF